MPDFKKYAEAGYGPELLPIIPPDAQISRKHSRDPDAVEKTRGKNPGKRLKDGEWVGFAKWTEYTQAHDDLERWGRWGGSVGLRSARFPALDIDVEDEGFVRAFLKRAQPATSYLYGRVGRHPRLLLPFRAADGYEVTGKPVLKLPMFDRVRPDGKPDRAKIELLGVGQQYVIEGIHPKTGQPYSWGGRGFPRADQLPVLDAAAAAALFAIAAEIAGVKPEELPATPRHGAKNQVAVSTEEFPAVEALVRSIPIESLDYDGWVKAGVAIKALTGDDGLSLWIEWSLGWPENTEGQAISKWNSFQPPFAAGWDTLRAMAPKSAAGELAAFDFTTQPEAQTPLHAVLDRYIWVQRTEQAFDTESRACMSSLQFSVANNLLGAPTGKTSAWAQWLAQPNRLRRAASLTYRPGGKLLVREDEGECVNTWTAPKPLPDVPHGDADIAPWLEHVGYLVPDARERRVFLDWLAAVAQRPNEKPNWHIVFGSTQFGMGKDLILQPMRRAIGGSNVRSIQPETLLGQWTEWYARARLIVVAEMQNYGKRELETKLRPYLAAPPDYVSIAERHKNTYEVPNIGAFIFLTNKPDALPISAGDRRFFVLWNELEPLSEQYFIEFVAWLRGGGEDAVAAWLMARDVATVNLQGRAPMTSAKEEMQGLTLTGLEAWIKDGIADSAGPFECDLIEIGDLLTQVPRSTDWKGATERRLAQYLKAAGAKVLERGRLGKYLASTGRNRGRLYSLRRHEMYAECTWQKLVDFYWGARDKAENHKLKGEFDVIEG